MKNVKRHLFDSWNELKKIAKTLTYSETKGAIVTVKDGVAKVLGLGSIKSGEMVLIGSKVTSSNKPNGMVLSLNEGYVSVVIFDTNSTHIECGSVVTRCSVLTSIPVALSVFGRAIDSLGIPVDGRGALSNKACKSKIDTKAVGIIPRESVKEPMQTGVVAVDALTPVGCGQRELIIGDRQTGKTSVALDSMISQLSYSSMFCIYVAVGQKKGSIAKIYDLFYGEKSVYKGKAAERLALVSSSSADSAILQFLAPYSGCTLGEWVGRKGGQALIVYDDLSKQAIAYRQMALLLRRPPGREAYPGDVFYLHSRLLERSAKLSVKYGGGSLTALPIIETQAGDVSAYIPTNVISITDGQIFLETKLFNEGIRPAINVGLSVSRIGSAAQIKAMKQVASTIKLELAQYREIESFASFASELDLSTKQILRRGVRLITTIKQQNRKVLDSDVQVVLLFAAMNGAFDTIEDSELDRFKFFLLNFFVISNTFDNFSGDLKLDSEYLKQAVNVLA
jgi:proton translocating ATP synthase F1 alpha subunit